jgi:hypothetical protein
MQASLYSQPTLETFNFIDLDDEIDDVTAFMEAEDADQGEETIILAPIEDTDVDFDPETEEVVPLFV